MRSWFPFERIVLKVRTSNRVERVWKIFDKNKKDQTKKMSQTTDQTLPRIQIQPDWNETLSEKQVGSKFWVNMLYKNSSDNVYGFLKLDSGKKLVKEGLPDSIEIANVVATKSLSLKLNDQTFKYLSCGNEYPSKHAVS